MFKKTDRFDQIFILVGTLILVAIGYVLLIDTIPKFTDLVFSEYSRNNAINKDYELLLIKGLIFLNVAVSSVYCYKLYKDQNKPSIAKIGEVKVNEHLLKKNEFITFFLLGTNIVYLIGVGRTNQLLQQLLFLWLISLYYEHKLDRGEVKYLKAKIICLFYLVKLSVLTILMLFQNLFLIGVFKSPYLSFEYAASIISVSTVIMFFALILMAYKKDILDKIIVNIQLILPLSMLHLLENLYRMPGSEEILHRAQPVSFTILIITLTIAFTIFQVINRLIYFNDGEEKDLNSLLTTLHCVFLLYIFVQGLLITSFSVTYGIMVRKYCHTTKVLFLKKICTKIFSLQQDYILI